ncbi:MAG TPA: hypothetical protein HPP87_09020 [Planctomycetes bacterium]|nr:hypothetical protein [Planctomycetota bacterium]
MSKKVEKPKNKNAFKDVMKMAVEVADRVQLEEVRFVGDKCELISFPSTKQNRFETTAMTDFNADRNENILFVLVHFGLDAVDKSDKPLAKIQADMLLLYHIENLEGLTDEHFKHFADKNAVFNAWPYWREFVQSATARMQLPPLTLPTYRFGMNLPEKSTISGAKKAILATKKGTAKKRPGRRRPRREQLTSNTKRPSSTNQ